MIEPAASDDVLLADIKACLSDDDTLHVWWLGQSGFLIQYRQRHLLFDPYLSDSLTRKYAETDKPHVRMTRRTIDPAELDFVDVVTSSHNHTDHLDADTLLPLKHASPQIEILVPAANRQFAADRLKLPPERLEVIDAGGTIELAGFRFHGVPAAHEEVDRDEQGRCKYLGLVVEVGPWCIYHSGDTMLYEGMVEDLKQWSIDLAILPINGRAPERRVSGNLWGREAAKLAESISARMVIPCHYEMFEFNTASPDEFVANCEQLGQPHTVLQAGQRHTMTSARSDH